MITSVTERVRRYRARRRQANPKEPLWHTLEGRLNVAILWISRGGLVPDSFTAAIRTVAQGLGLLAPVTSEPTSRPEQPQDPATIEEWTLELTAPLSATGKRQLERGLKRLLSRLADDFRRQVQQGIDKGVAEERERLAAQGERLTALEQEVRAEHDAITKMRQGITAYMTEEEYNLIRGLLHPDRHPGDEQDRYTQAFTVFKRLKEMINPGISKKVLRDRGWEQPVKRRP